MKKITQIEAIELSINMWDQMHQSNIEDSDEAKLASEIINTLIKLKNRLEKRKSK